MPKPGEIVSFGFVVEGQGEFESVPLLIRRICFELLGFYTVRTSRPVRITKSKLVRPGELERAIRLARINNRGSGPVVVILDADEDCPAVLGPMLKARALAVAPAHEVSISIPKWEFEAWFLAAAESLSGRQGLRERLAAPPNPEAIRGAKEWLTRNMLPGRAYSPTADQDTLTAGMDLTAARFCPSFDRLCREVERLIAPG